MKIASSITYCTNDYRYLAKCIEEAKKFSDQIVVITCDHFFCGKRENRLLLNQSYSEHPDLSFVEMTYRKDHLYSEYINRKFTDNDWIDFWYSTTRYISFLFAKKEIDYILFLDSDEIIEGEKFKIWLNTLEYQKYDAMRFLQYYYFRNACFRAKAFQIGGLFLKKGAVRPSQLMDTDDRCGIFHKIEGRKKEKVTLKGVPFIHHYSWVKTLKESLIKAKYLSNHWERDWIAAVNCEFSKAFSGKDFENRDYEKVSDIYFDPLQVSLMKKEVEGPFLHVHKVDMAEIKRRELAFEFHV